MVILFEAGCGRNNIAHVKLAHVSFKKWSYVCVDLPLVNSVKKDTLGSKT